MEIKKVFLSIMFVLGFLRGYSQNGVREEQLAEQYYRNGDFEKALVIYEGLYSKNRSQVYYDPYFDLLLKLRKYDEAAKLVKEMSAAEPEWYFPKVDYGRILQEKGEAGKADEWYRNLIRGLPADENRIRDLAAAFYRANGYEYAASAFRQGRKLLKEESAFTFDLLGLYRFLKNKESLSEEYVRLLAENPTQSMLSQAKSALAQVFEPEADYGPLKDQLLRALRKETSNPALNDLLIWTCVQQKDFAEALKQSELLDKKLKEDGERIYDLAMLFISAKAYDRAAEALRYLTGKGRNNQYYIPARAELLDCRYRMVTEEGAGAKEVADLESDYEALLTEFGRNRNTAYAMHQLALLRAWYSAEAEKAETLLEDILRMPQLQQSFRGQVKLDLGDIYILTGEVWEATLIYGQAEKEFANEPPGQEAKFRNARLSYFRGDFTWAKAQLDVLKSSTSQLTANDALNLSLLIAENTAAKADSAALTKYASADRAFFCRRNGEAVSILDSIDRLYPGNSLSDDILMLKAKIFLSEKKTDQAVSCLQTICDKYAYDTWADDALFMLGDIYQNQLRQPEKAEACFKKLITDYPASLYVAEARVRFRNLRGDKLG